MFWVIELKIYSHLYTQYKLFWLRLLFLFDIVFVYCMYLPKIMLLYHEMEIIPVSNPRYLLIMDIRGDVWRQVLLRNTSNVDLQVHYLGRSYSSQVLEPRLFGCHLLLYVGGVHPIPFFPKPFPNQLKMCSLISVTIIKKPNRATWLLLPAT